MAPVSKEPNEAEILLNRVNVALARSQRLIASWLPQSTADEDSSTNTKARLVEADDDLFHPETELLGVGAIVVDKSSDGAVHKEATALDLLRKRILGKKAGNTMLKASKSFGQASLAQGKMTRTSAQSPQPIDVTSEDDEEGRTTVAVARDGARVGNSKRIISSPNVKMRSRQEASGCTDDMTVEGKAGLDSSAKAFTVNIASTKRKSANFLDEILAEKANKKKRKKKKLKGNLDQGVAA